MKPSRAAAKRGNTVLAIGGLDPSGRAGLLADVETIRSLGAHACAVATCLTAQGKTPRSTPVAPELIAAQLAALSAIDAVKIGAVPNRAALAVIARYVAKRGVPVVVDPVRVTSKGLRLSTLRPGDYARLPQKSVVLTPNRDEWPALQPLRGFGAIVVKSFEPGVDAVFLDGSAEPKLLKGGVLVRSPSHRGTGCRFASALAVGLAKGHTVTHAAQAAKRSVRKFLRAPILP
ncbi:MAG: bifunctional hydroxymethylpyrimidine kinase/phosphomethylpyrimidine kinase [Myxococcaceae bacterium]|nr:bifunctional hydroxymethylpyrimidine kinase/phosphomethylpyrimidine kinase [Myxococcaceae bacterium]